MAVGARSRGRGARFAAAIAWSLAAVVPGSAAEGAAQSTSDVAQTERACRSVPQSIWVVMPEGSACLRYARSAPRAAAAAAIVTLGGPPDDGTRFGSMTRDDWARVASVPVVDLAIRSAAANPGTQREVDLVSTALDQLKGRLGVGVLHLVGLGPEGNLAATLAIRRADVGCVAMAGAWLSERDRLAETGETFAPATLRAANDPMTEIAQVTPRAGRRLIDFVDPVDSHTPDAALSAFAAAARAHDVSFERRTLPALSSPLLRADSAMRAAVGCVTGRTDDEITENLRPASPAQPRPNAPPPPQSEIGALILTPPSTVTAPFLPQQSVIVATQDPPPVTLPLPRRQVAIGPDGQPKPSLLGADPATFTRAELLSGKTIDATSCALLPFAVWVTRVGTPECIRYYYSQVGGAGSRALVFLNGDFAYRGLDGQPTVDAEYARLTPADLQHVAEVRSRDYRGPMIYLARPGTLGSSGDELQVRHSPREVALVAAALDEIKRRHGLATLDIVGHSGGGLIVGALVAERNDIGCAVSSSGVLATNAWTSERLNLPRSNSGFLFDPLEHVDEIRAGRDFRYILLTDAADVTVSATSTRLYLDALDVAGVPHLHVALEAADAAHHDLALAGFRAAIACSHGASDAEITTLLTKTLVTDARVPDRGPLGEPGAPSTGDGAADRVAPSSTP